MDEKTTRYYDEIMSEMNGVEPTPDQLEKLAQLLYLRDQAQESQGKLEENTKKLEELKKEINGLLQYNKISEPDGISKE